LHLIGVSLIGLHLIGLHLIGVQLIGVHLIHVYEIYAAVGAHLGGARLKMHVCKIQLTCE
jgi:hypothetical protein